MMPLPRNILVFVPFLMLIIMVGLAWSTRSDSTGDDSTTEVATFLTPSVGPTGHFSRVQVSSDGTQHLIPLEDIRAGGPPKDGIPSIDAPRFASSDRWSEYGFHGENLVIGVEVNGSRRAYPFQVLVWHEIVNDTIDGVPLLITYCPLCGTGIVFERNVNREPVEFGVSGKLYNSDMLMYDRKTDSLWSQITGTAVVGELVGERLTLYPSEIMTWHEWQATYPDSVVLTTETGHNRNYTVDPYDGYYTDSSIWFPVAARDTRLPVKEPVTGIEVEGPAFAAYPDEAVMTHGPINDVVGETAVMVLADPTAGNTIRVFDRRIGNVVLTFRLSEDGLSLLDDMTQSQWTFSGHAISGDLATMQLAEIVPVRGFWFAWFAFHQDTKLWLPD